MCRFLLVSLNIEAILGEVTICQRRKKLEGVERGNGLSDAYTATLTRLKAQKGSRPGLGLKALTWVLYSERPLSAKELCYALGVEIGATDLDPENVPAIRTLLSSCLGLVTVEKYSSAVRLVHFTLQEHFTSDPTLFCSPHSTIAEICLTHLNFECFRRLSDDHRVSPTTPLLDYASCYWGQHAKKGMTENVKVLALRLLDRFEEHISALLLLFDYIQHQPNESYFKWEGETTGFTALQGAAFLGIGEIVVTLLEMKGWDINATDYIGSTALMWAAKRGEEEVVKLLLEQEDINPNQEDTRYRHTALAWAAKCGQEGVVKILLKRKDVNPDHEHSKTPLFLAAMAGHEGVVKLLLEREDVNPNRATRYNSTPLSIAAREGNEGVVKVLLEREDVNPDQGGTAIGETPLLCAAGHGHEGVVKMLLEREEVNLNHEDHFGGTPLSSAAWGGNEGVVKMLLEREDVSPDRLDTKCGRTPLSRAASAGREGVVKILLEREDVNPNQIDTCYGRTPLSWAAGEGHEGVVKMLLEREGLNPNQVDTKQGRTPLSWAAGKGHAGVVKVLLECEGLNPS